MRVFTYSANYPCQWDDLCVPGGGLFATIQTKLHVDSDPCPGELLPVGINRCEEDGIWDIVVDVPEITNEVVRAALDELSGLTGDKYEWQPAKDATP